MKKILYTILTAAAVLFGNYWFSNGTIKANVVTPVPTILATLPAATSSPQPVESTATNITFEGTQVSYNGTSFIIPPGLASETKNELVPQNAPEMPLQAWPAHQQFTLQGYFPQGTTYQPQIMLFPAAQYAQLGDQPKQIIERLQDILKTKDFSPQPVPAMFQTLRPQEELPLLPFHGAGQVLHAQEKFLSFRNGSGIRYITQLSQAAFPLINNQDIFYTFQGLSSDGKTYVSVILPLSLPYLAVNYGADSNNPADVQSPDKYPAYLNSTRERLDQSEGAGVNPYAPSLASMDLLVQSLLAGETLAAEPASTSVVSAEPPAAQVDGAWVTNVGRLTLKQNGPEVTGTLTSYGDTLRQDALQGVLNGDVLALNSQMLGNLSLTFSGDTFRTAPGSRVAFCGIRAALTNELPAGCGFSGQWNLAANSFFPGASYVLLKQVDGNVSGDFYDGKGNAFDKLTGQIYWGKGWGLSGKNANGHLVTLVMNSFETGFEYIYDDLYQLKLCAVRNGLSSADLGNFICSL